MREPGSHRRHADCEVATIRRELSVRGARGSRPEVLSGETPRTRALRGNFMGRIGERQPSDGRCHRCPRLQREFRPHLRDPFDLSCPRPRYPCGKRGAPPSLSSRRVLPPSGLGGVVMTATSAPNSLRPVSSAHDKPEILSVRTAARSRLFHIESVQLKFANGSRREFERIAAGPGPGTALVVAMPDPATVLLVREYAVGLDRFELSLPMGRIEPGGIRTGGGKPRAHGRDGIQSDRAQGLAYLDAGAGNSRIPGGDHSRNGPHSLCSRG